MVGHGHQVAVVPLHQVALPDRVAARVLVDGAEGVEAVHDGVRRLVAGALREQARTLGRAADGIERLGPVLPHARAVEVDASVRLGDTQVQEWVPRCAPLGGGRHPRAVAVEERVESPARGADGGACDGVPEGGQPGHAKQRPVVDPHARLVALVDVDDAVGHVLRHESVVQDHGLAARAPQSGHLPTVLIDLEVAPGDHEAPELGLFDVADHGAQDRPRRVVDAAAEVPAAAQAEAARRRLGVPRRGIRGRGQGVGPRREVLVLRGLREVCDLPVVNADERREPTGGRAPGGDPAGGLEERGRVDLEPAVLVRGHRPEHAGGA